MISRKHTITTLIVTSLIATNTLATRADSGFIGANLGYSEVHASDVTHASRLAFGVNAGYNFDQYFGIEMQGNQDGFYKYNGDDSTHKIYDIDLLADGYAPLENNFDLVGKAGLAYVRESGNWHFYRPKLIAGLMYTTTENVSITASYSRIFKQGNINKSGKYLPDVDVAAITLDYLF